MKNIYLDYNSHTPCDISVVRKMNELWTQPGNPHSNGHSFGWKKDEIIKNALQTFADIYDCFEEDLLFTSGATEANNLAIFSGIPIAMRLKSQADTILTSYLEHKSVLAPLELMAKQKRLQLIYIKLTPNGTIDLDDLEHNLNSHKVLWVSCAMTNGVIGTNQPITQISNLCSQHKALLHVDASQAGYLPISCLDLDIDFLAISAHKIYGPSGIGLLYSKYLNNPHFTPMIVGGGQQNGLRAGTLATPLIAGFQRACEIFNCDKENEAGYLKKLRNSFLKGLRNEFDVEVIGDINNRHPGNLYLLMEGVDSMQLLNNLQPRLAFSLGSACDGFSREYMPLMKAMQISKERAETGFRICVGRITTAEEVDLAVKLIINAANIIGRKNNRS